MILTSLKEQLTRKMMIPKQFLPDSSIWQLRGRFSVIINISLFGAEKYSFTYDDFKVHAMILTIYKNWKKKKKLKNMLHFPPIQQDQQNRHDIVKGKVHWKYLPTWLIYGNVCVGKFYYHYVYQFQESKDSFIIG